MWDFNHISHKISPFPQNLLSPWSNFCVLRTVPPMNNATANQVSHSNIPTIYGQLYNNNFTNSMPLFIYLFFCIVCSNSSTCPPVTDQQMKCMEDAGSKNSTDVTMHCKGVDIDALKKGEVNKIATHHFRPTTWVLIL